MEGRGVFKNVQTLLADAENCRQLADELGGDIMRQALLDMADAAERAAAMMDQRLHAEYHHPAHSSG
jgi:hypothetical protein